MVFIFVLLKFKLMTAFLPFSHAFSPSLSLFLLFGVSNRDETWTWYVSMWLLNRASVFHGLIAIPPKWLLKAL